MTPNLNRWYISKCDGNWEHQYGINIATLDNPGWLVTVRLADTNISPGDQVLFQEGQWGEDGKPWVDIRVRGEALEGACSPDCVNRLDEYLAKFLDGLPSIAL
jgi:Immunity protein 53